MTPKQIHETLRQIAHQVVADSPGWALSESEAGLQFLNVLSGGTVLLSGQGLCLFLKEIGWRGRQTELEEFLNRSCAELLAAYETQVCRGMSFGSPNSSNEAHCIGMQYGSDDRIVEVGQLRRVK